MGDAPHLVTMETLMAPITNLTTQMNTMQADLGICKTRLDQWEQPNPNGAPLGLIPVVQPAPPIYGQL